MIHGVYHFGSKLVACRNAYCTTCGSPEFTEGRRSLVVLHLMFVPVLPIGVVTRWYCGRCKQESDARRPSRPWALVAGIVLGFLALLAGISLLSDDHETEAAIGCFIFGPGMIAGCGYALRKPGYQRYEAARRAVTPLASDRCPYCGEPILASTKPRCHSCRVNIVTQ